MAQNKCQYFTLKTLGQPLGLHVPIQYNRSSLIAAINLKEDSMYIGEEVVERPILYNKTQQEGSRHGAAEMQQPSFHPSSNI